MPPAADAVAEVVATVTERGAALLFSPVLTARAGRAWAAELRAARRVRDHLADRLGADRVVTRALPPVVVARGYGEVVARRLGAVDLLAPSARGGVDAEVAALVAAGTPGPGEQGVVVLLTGLSGSGKSTVAQRLYGRLLEDGRRTVTLLDGDLVRRSLSSELTFSKEHRDLNVRRIGFVAAEVARHGGIALLAPIAPYDAPRRDVRRLVEEAGGRFVLVHVDTPLEVCEQRDVKGLYAAARAGRIPNFTGISDPYEVPQDADLRLDTSQVSLDDAVDQLLELLTREGHLPT
ncbi:adenylyl-sulfate kinase [Nitriliruptoraceae bacterium ZYF776]|nr:adenylyl-sulfate kinase [Profundirhabdus halotolerans]